MGGSPSSVALTTGSLWRASPFLIRWQRLGKVPFDSCKSLESITIPDSVTEIGRWAFCGCSSLKSITIPDSVTEIGSHAFDGCSSLKSITIPDWNFWKAFGSTAFARCTALESITITIPDSVTEIGFAVFISLLKNALISRFVICRRDSFANWPTSSMTLYDWRMLKMAVQKKPGVYRIYLTSLFEKPTEMCFDF